MCKGQSSPDSFDAACCLEGDFVLRSGQRSSVYFDKYLFEGDPTLLREVIDHAIPMIPSDTEVLAGLELGGIPIATALSLATGLPMALVRKEAKAYGTAKLAEGTDVDGKHLLIVEDVITTGGQVVLSATDLRDRGAMVDGALCIIDRSVGTNNPLKHAGITLHALFNLSDLVP